MVLIFRNYYKRPLNLIFTYRSTIMKAAYPVDTSPESGYNKEKGAAGKRLAPMK